MELQQVQPNYLDKLKSELDIDPTLVADSPQWIAQVDMGQRTYSGMTYTFRYVKGRDNQIVGAMVKPTYTRNLHTKTASGDSVQDDAPREEKEFFVSKDKLNQMLNQEQPTANQGGVIK